MIKAKYVQLNLHSYFALSFGNIFSFEIPVRIHIVCKSTCNVNTNHVTTSQSNMASSKDKVLASKLAIGNYNLGVTLGIGTFGKVKCKSIM
jgi:hypothetical protein